MKKRVLFVSSPFMGIYKDVIDALEKIEYDVEWVSADLFPKNPLNIYQTRVYDEVEIKKFLNKLDIFWSNYLSEDKQGGYFDYFFTIDGLIVSPMLFKLLKEKNPKVINLLYLFDRIDGIYQIDWSLSYYDRKYSFDIGDCKKYSLNLLPIYWIDTKYATQIVYKIFGFASYSFEKKERTLLFRQIADISKTNKWDSYIKLYINMERNKVMFYIKNIIKFFIRREEYINIKDLFSGFITGNSIDPSKFRDMIKSSDVILDTQALYQDGLTARFMWSLGAEKKIITTNVAVTQYPFYDEHQFYIINGALNDRKYSEIIKFIRSDFKMNDDKRKEVEKYRIDNWIKTIFDF